jgi:hypothetical protein
MTVEGTVRGKTICLEETVPGLEGRRVRLELEVIEESPEPLPPEEQERAWASWVDRGPQGPMDDEDGATWP